MERFASAHWEGSGRHGHGDLTTQSLVLNGTPYSFLTRFGEDPGTNPEELLAAAHSGCFTMKLAFVLEGAGYTPTSLDTKATVTLDPNSGITQIVLDLTAVVPDLSETDFQGYAADAKENCPVSKLFAGNTTITLNATLTT